jgi:hypothetical protein
VKTRALLLIGFALAGAAHAVPPCPSTASWPPPFRFEYDAKATLSFLGLSGTSTLALTRAADDYALVYETVAGVWFSARQTSRGRIGADGVMPLEYTERNGNKPQLFTHLDWSAGRVTFSATDKAVPTQPQMQDRLSLLLQVGWLLRANAASFALSVAGVRGSSNYDIVKRGAETVETPAGRFQTIKFERPMSEHDDRIEVWIAPALCSLPVRVRFTDRKGLMVGNELRSANFD